MNGENKVLVIGRVSRKGTLSYSKEGVAILDIVLAIPKREALDSTEYFPVQLIMNAALEGEDIKVGLDAKVEGFLRMKTTVGKDSKPHEKIELLGTKIETLIKE